ncbi:hypothetical protein BDZ97DRAFT_2067954 [Flammula alnicola]|nr:hypothetical protein BDZ97DRAFT_2067954 [Flammula alnicola]
MAFIVYGLLGVLGLPVGAFPMCSIVISVFSVGGRYTSVHVTDRNVFVQILGLETHKYSLLRMLRRLLNFFSNPAPPNPSGDAERDIRGAQVNAGYPYYQWGGQNTGPGGPIVPLQPMFYPFQPHIPNAGGFPAPYHGYLPPPYPAPMMFPPGQGLGYPFQIQGVASANAALSSTEPRGIGTEGKVKEEVREVGPTSMAVQSGKALKEEDPTNDATDWPDGPQRREVPFGLEKRKWKDTKWVWRSSGNVYRNGHTPRCGYVWACSLAITRRAGGLFDQKLGRLHELSRRRSLAGCVNQIWCSQSATRRPTITRSHGMVKLFWSGNTMDTTSILGLQVATCRELKKRPWTNRTWVYSPLEISPALANPRAARYQLSQSQARLGIAPSVATKGGLSILRSLAELQEELKKPFMINSSLHGPVFLMFQTPFMETVLQDSISPGMKKILKRRGLAFEKKYLLHVFDFSASQRGAHAEEFADAIIAMDPRFRSLTAASQEIERNEYLKQAQEAERGCEFHFWQSAERIMSNGALVPQAKSGEFNRISRIHGWLSWWLRPAFASMIFPAVSAIDRTIADQIPTTSNPVEHQHSLLHHAVSVDQDLIPGIKKLFLHVQELESQYSAIKAYSLWSDEARQAFLLLVPKDSFLDGLTYRYDRRLKYMHDSTSLAKFKQDLDLTQTIILNYVIDKWKLVASGDMVVRWNGCRLVLSAFRGPLPLNQRVFNIVSDAQADSNVNLDRVFFENSFKIPDHDGSYVTYELIGRVLFEGNHFTSQLRFGGRAYTYNDIDGKLVPDTDSNLLETRDTRSVFYVYHRSSHKSMTSRTVNEIKLDYERPTIQKLPSSISVHSSTPDAVIQPATSIGPERSPSPVLSNENPPHSHTLPLENSLDLPPICEYTPDAFISCNSCVDLSCWKKIFTDLGDAWCCPECMNTPGGRWDQHIMFQALNRNRLEIYRGKSSRYTKDMGKIKWPMRFHEDANDNGYMNTGIRENLEGSYGAILEIILTQRKHPIIHSRGNAQAMYDVEFEQLFDLYILAGDKSLMNPFLVQLRHDTEAATLDHHHVHLLGSVLFSLVIIRTYLGADSSADDQIFWLSRKLTQHQKQSILPDDPFADAKRGHLIRHLTAPEKAMAASVPGELLGPHAGLLSGLRKQVELAGMDLDLPTGFRLSGARAENGQIYQFFSTTANGLTGGPPFTPRLITHDYQLASTPAFTPAEPAPITPPAVEPPKKTAKRSRQGEASGLRRSTYEESRNNFMQKMPWKDIHSVERKGE